MKKRYDSILEVHTLTKIDDANIIRKRLEYALEQN